MKNYFAARILVITFIASNALEAQTNNEAAKESKTPRVSFRSEVFPIIKKNCLPCHAEENFNPSDLHMDTYESLMEGGKHGSPIVVGKPEESLLIQKLSDKPPFGEQMPLKSKTGLSEKERRIIADWITQGAKGR